MAAHAATPQGYYAAGAAEKPRATLAGTETCDVCVVGGGFTGVSAALHLAERGARVVLLEAQSIGFAASGRNGGQIHSGQRHSQSMLESWLGVAHARDLWWLAEEAKTTLRALIARHGISCALKSGLVIAAHNKKSLRSLAEDCEHLTTAYGYTQLRMLDAQEIAAALGTNIYPGGHFDEGGGHLHPLQFVRGLAEAAEKAGAVLFEQSRAQTINTEGCRKKIVCRNGTVEADHVLLALDAFGGAIAPQLAPYIAHVESFIVATAPLDDGLNAQVVPCDAAVADTRHVLDYYRKSADHRLLFAGRESYFTIPGNISSIVRPRMLRVFPMLKNTPVDYAWSGTVGITRTRMPHFGRLDSRTWFAHGYSGHGVALSILGGKLLAEAASGQTDRFEVFARIPQRPFPGGALLRKPLVTAGLFWNKLRDSF